MRGRSGTGRSSMPGGHGASASAAAPLDGGPASPPSDVEDPRLGGGGGGIGAGGGAALPGSVSGGVKDGRRMARPGSSVLSTFSELNSWPDWAKAHSLSEVGWMVAGVCVCVSWALERGAWTQRGEGIGAQDAPQGHCELRGREAFTNAEVAPGPDLVEQG